MLGRPRPHLCTGLDNTNSHPPVISITVDYKQLPSDLFFALLDWDGKRLWEEDIVVDNGEAMILGVERFAIVGERDHRSCAFDRSDLVMSVGLS